VPDKEYFHPLEGSEITREGSDVTLFGYNISVHWCVQAAQVLARQYGINAEVVDLYALAPLDRAGIAASVRKTHRAVIVEEAEPVVGVGAEVMAIINEECFLELDAAPVRVSAANVPVPYNHGLEKAAIPNAGDVVAAVRVARDGTLAAALQTAGVESVAAFDALRIGFIGNSLGAVVGATPDGRRAREPLSESISPSQGRDVKGPTATLMSISSTKCAQYKERAARLLNMKLSPASLVGEEGTRKLMSLIRTACDMKMWHIQFNIINRDTLLAAQKDPEKYRNLLVRVAGYSAYFVDLTPALQSEIIRRTEHEF